MANKIIVILFCLFLLTCNIFANPFFGSDEDTVTETNKNTIIDAPKVRGVTSSGPMVDTQRNLREKTADAINSFAKNPNAKALFVLLFSSFLYGLLHALGPGHRKTIVFSLFLGRKTSILEPLGAGFFSAIIHAGSGILIVGILSIIKGAVTGLGDAEKVSAWFDIATFALLILMALILMIDKLAKIIKSKKQEVEKTKNNNLYRLIAISSLVPCPGAIMILLFALYSNLIFIGVLCVLSMSVGMGIVISASGYLAWFGREGLFYKLKSNKDTVTKITNALELLSYFVLLCFSLYMIIPAFY